MNDRLIVLNEVDSTQDEARRRFLAGEAGPLWILARGQTKGRGRAGRTWVSAPGNLHLSLLLTPPLERRRWPELSLLAGLVAHKALAHLAMRAGRPELREELRLKWPNDLLLNGRKLGGILLETVDVPPPGAPEPPDAPATPAMPVMPDAPPAEARAALIIGWGINLRSAPREARWPAVSLHEAGLDVAPSLLFDTLRDAFRRWYPLWRERGMPKVRLAWLKRACGLGGGVHLSHGRRRLRGRFVDLGPAGELVLELDDGTRRLFNAGEVSGLDLPEESAD